MLRYLVRLLSPAKMAEVTGSGVQRRGRLFPVAPFAQQGSTSHKGIHGLVFALALLAPAALVGLVAGVCQSETKTHQRLALCALVAKFLTYRQTLAVRPDRFDGPPCDPEGHAERVQSHSTGRRVTRFMPQFGRAGERIHHLLAPIQPTECDC